ncbi:MAG: DUF2585 domain-containing protein [Porphyrobacter sp.]|nr:DUF2585 domain-containing protein [Porphyrobacter sp.]
MKIGTLVPDRRTILVAVAIAVVAIVILLAMGRSPVCECGYVSLWHGQINDAGNSQHITDWYTPSHIIHGMIFYAFGWWLFVRRGIGGAGAARWGFPLAVLLGAAWEGAENTPVVINRFRAGTANFGYSGDSVLNSGADIIWMSFGFWLALRLPVKVTVALALIGELVAGYVVRDNLTLNVIMLLVPVDAIAQWQAAGGVA